jgi:hypothetical protein
LLGRIQARSSGSLHHDACVLENLLSGAIFQLVANDVCGRKKAQSKNWKEKAIEQKQKFENPHAPRNQSEQPSGYVNAILRCVAPAETEGIHIYNPIDLQIRRGKRLAAIFTTLVAAFFVCHFCFCFFSVRPTELWLAPNAFPCSPHSRAVLFTCNEENCPSFFKILKLQKLCPIESPIWLTQFLQHRLY